METAPARQPVSFRTWGWMERLYARMERLYARMERLYARMERLYAAQIASKAALTKCVVPGRQRYRRL